MHSSVPNVCFCLGSLLAKSAHNHQPTTQQLNMNSSSYSDLTFASVPRFVRILYNILQHEDPHILSWSADGSHFQVYDVTRLEMEVLPKYFKHSKLSSFQRQLNNFGFHKWTKTRASVATFSHETLHCCHPSQLSALVSEMKKSSKSTKRQYAQCQTTPEAPKAKKQKASPLQTAGAKCQEKIRQPAVVLQSWELEQCSHDDLLLDALDAIELFALDWDAAISPAVLIEDEEVLSELLTEENTCAFLFELDNAEATMDCELDALFEGIPETTGELFFCM
ncbi:hypothetical protein BBJ28_00017329 [Nothophytophthora sp. Chile5]|nr:hypothetical protein BBJ28_00017329 [Nothophytophthora sp. Chile5]